MFLFDTRIISCMKLKRLQIKNFRRHSELVWDDVPDVACLIGPGDSGKTSILEAIHYLLQPYYKQPFEEFDFNDFDKSIEISGCFVLSDDSPLLSEDKYGLYLSGWDGELLGTGLNLSGPMKHEEKALYITLSCDNSLEPRWFVSNDSGQKEFSLKDRKFLSSLYVDVSNSQRSFTWANGTALRNNLPDGVDVKGVLNDIVSHAKEGAKGSSKIDEIAVPETLKNELISLGVSNASDSYDAGLDINAISANINEVCLHKNSLPFRKMGQGTQRLFAVASQLLTTGLAPVLVDEIELGLDPSRIRRLIRSLEEKDEQIIFTTHSPIVLRELSAESLCKVVDGKVLSFASLNDLDNVQSRVRSYAESLLSNKLIVCEGKTEVAFCRGLDDAHLKECRKSFSGADVSFVNAGGGTNVEKVAHVLTGMGYEVCAFLDSDDLSHTVDDLNGSIDVIRWEDGLCLESAIFKNLKDEDLKFALKTFIEGKGFSSEQSFLSKFKNGAGFDYKLADELELPLDKNTKYLIGKGIGKAEVFKPRVSLTEAFSKELYRRVYLKSDYDGGHVKEIIEKLLGWAE